MIDRPQVIGKHCCLLAVDPGGTTGWVLLREDGSVEDWGEERDQQKFLTMVWQLLMDDVLTDVVCERWVTMRGRPMTFEPTAQEIIGALAWMAGYTHTSYTLQGAADAKAFRDPPAEYKPVGRGGGGHARMALRHALLYRALKGLT